MSTDMDIVQWQEPHLTVDEAGTVQLDLGVIPLPPTVNPSTVERVLAVVTEMIGQMVEEDILPELMNPDNEVYTDGLALVDEPIILDDGPLL